MTTLGDGSPNQKIVPPRATTPERRENQLLNLAVDLAEEQLRSGTASAQVIVHYLKLATTRERLEQEKLKRENILLAARAEALESTKHLQELFENAISAMQRYSGHDASEEKTYDS